MLGGIGWVAGGRPPASISLLQVSEWSKKGKANLQPGRLSPLLGSQVVTQPPPASEEGGSTAPRELGQGRSLTNTVLWKLVIGTEASEAAVIPNGCQRVLEPLLWGGSDLIIIQMLSFHPYTCGLSALPVYFQVLGDIRTICTGGSILIKNLVEKLICSPKTKTDILRNKIPNSQGFLFNKKQF